MPNRGPDCLKRKESCCPSRRDRRSETHFAVLFTASLGVVTIRRLMQTERWRARFSARQVGEVDEQVVGETPSSWTVLKDGG